MELYNFTIRCFIYFMTKFIYSLFKTKCSHEWWYLQYFLVIDFIYHYCRNFCFHWSIFYILSCMWDHVMNVFLLCSVFDYFFPKLDCWFIFGIFVYIFDLRSLHVYFSFHCRIQYLYWMHFSVWPSCIGRCLLCITNFIHSWNLNTLLVLLNWHILLLVDWIVIITLYVFLQIWYFVFIDLFFSL